MDETFGRKGIFDQQRGSTQNSSMIENNSDLFAEGPARDSRFTVVERWTECANFPPDHPERIVEFLHRQMNEEVNGLECSARGLSDFPEEDWSLRMCLARQCADESRHAQMFRRLLESKGGFVGQYPVLNFQYRIITKSNDLCSRMAIQNRSFEAGGIDAITYAKDGARQEGDFDLAELYEAQLADEITHVRFANEWIRASIQKDPRNVLRMGVALNIASKAFFQVMGKEGTEGVQYPADQEGRLEAGFTPEEIRLASDLAAGKSKS
ncbi:ferritin-like domain-containing protein [bacterium]|nr:ferritin-like domain-containing protein [bacterium]